MDRIFSNVRINAIATALPKEELDLASLESLYGEEYIHKVTRVTGIHSVHVAKEGQTSADLCVRAAQKLQTEGQYNPQDIDALVFVSETPDYVIPNTSAVIQSRLGLRNDILVFDLNFGCAGYVYGLFQAHLLVSSGYAKKVLLCVGDTLTKTIHPEDRALRMVLGDAGSATILSSDKEASTAGFSFYVDGGRADKLMIPAGGFRTPCKPGVTDVAYHDDDGNVRSDENMYMDGVEVMEFALHEVKGVAQRAYSLCNIDPQKIDLFALHQANAMIVKYVARKLKAPKEKVPVNINDTGNTSCTSIPLLLTKSFAGVHPEFKNVFVCGFGTGLTCAAGVVDLSRTQFYAPEILS